MTDDTMNRFRSSFGGPKKPPEPVRPTAAMETLARAAEVPASDEAYEAFKNKVRTTNVELRCHETGLSYFVEYAQMSPIVFDFRGATGIFFSAGGYGFTILGTNLHAIVRALRLRTCGTIQDFNPHLHVDAEPPAPDTLSVERIIVDILRPQRPGDAPPSAAKRTEKA
jgi:hypothetical protein